MDGQDAMTEATRDEADADQGASVVQSSAEGRRVGGGRHPIAGRRPAGDMEPLTLPIHRMLSFR